MISNILNRFRSHPIVHKIYKDEYYCNFIIVSIISKLKIKGEIKYSNKKGGEFLNG